MLKVDQKLLIENLKKNIKLIMMGEYNEANFIRDCNGKRSN